MSLNRIGLMVPFICFAAAVNALGVRPAPPLFRNVLRSALMILGHSYAALRHTGTDPTNEIEESIRSEATRCKRFFASSRSLAFGILACNNSGADLVLIGSEYRGIPSTLCADPVGFPAEDDQHDQRGSYIWPEQQSMPSVTLEQGVITLGRGRERFFVRP